ncbi:hypothetical protein IAU60_004353 [Kwoniella sp. DSM 27419]
MSLPTPLASASSSGPWNVSSPATSRSNGRPQTSPSGSSRLTPVATSIPTDGQAPLSPGRKRRKVTRSKLGCLTCRKRRKLCDMAKPACGACERLSLECAWPTEEMARADRRRSQASAPSPGVNQPVVANPPSVIPQLPDEVRHQVQLGQQHLSRTHPASNTMDDFVGIFGNIDHGTSSSMQPHSVEQINTDALGFEDLGATLAQSTLGVAANGVNSDSGLFDWLSEGGGLDEATLQLWAADCLAVPTTQTFNAFDSLNTVLLQPTPPSNMLLDPSALTDHLEAGSAAIRQSRSHAASRRPSRSPSRRGSDTPPGASQAALLSYFHDSLSRLVSITDDDAPSAFESFTKLAGMTAGRGPAGQALHFSILAWAARHAVNRGQSKYEAASEKFSGRSMHMLDSRMEELFDKKGKERPLSDAERDPDTDHEKMTLLAAALMIMQFKICRGDIFGFNNLVQHLTRLVPFVFRPSVHELQPDSMHTSFFENLLYHDVLGSCIVTQAPMIPDAIVQHFSGTGLDTLHTLTGVSLPLFSRMHRLSGLHRLRRSRKGKGWSDEDLVDVVQPALALEAELAVEKKRLDDLVLAKPHIQSHRYLHEAFRTACLLQLHGFVLGEPPCSLNIRLLVRQALSLLEAMCDESLPGLCSAHWVIFMAALCAVSGGQEEEALDDRDRIERIYEDVYAEFGFRNVERSRKIVHDVWKKNADGTMFVDWIDVLVENDWEIYVV